MAAPEVEDDRWRNFRMPEVTLRQARHRRTRADLFNEHLTRVLLQKSQRKKQEIKCKTAAHLVKLVTDIAYAMNAEWKEYTTANRAGVKTAPLRTLAEDKYECMVPLVRPMRLDGFSVIQRGIDEMPQHRCLVQVNPKLCKEEAYLVRREWETFVDKEGYLRPKAILEWFNRGLVQAVPVVLSENHNVDKLACSVGDDGTATLRATVSDFDGGELDINTFSINIYPVFPLDRLPTSLKLNAPLPCFGNYIHGQKEFRQLVNDDIENGKDVAFLDPKSEELHSPIKRCLPKDGPTWRINLSFTEYHVYSLIDKYCRGLNFRHVLVLMNILREENKTDLAVLNNELLVNTLFNVSQKYIDKLTTKEMWVHTVMQTLSDGLKNNFLPSFYLPRQNLLNYHYIGKRERTSAWQTLDVILAGLRRNPRTLYTFSGSVDPKKDQEEENGIGNPDGYDEPDTERDVYASQKGYCLVEDEPEGFYEDESERSGWPIDKGDNRAKLNSGGHTDKGEHPFERPGDQAQLYEDDSGISKPTRIGERSDIY